MIARVAITGVNGFVGRHLLDRVAIAGCQVLGIGRSAFYDSRCEYARLRDYGLDELTTCLKRFRPDAIVHLAASSSVGRSWHAPDEVIEANARLVSRLLVAAHESVSGARLLLVGSSEQYGMPQSTPITEEHRQKPRNPYGVSKAAAETLALGLADTFDLDLVCTRSFNHFGPEQSRGFVVSDLAAQVAEAEVRGQDSVTLTVGDTTIERDFTDVRDVVNAYWLLLAAGKGAFNVCSQEAVSIEEILRGLADSSSIHVDWRTETSKLRSNEVPRVIGSNHRIRELNGWQPCHTMSATLADTLDSWREVLRTARV